MDKSKEQPSRQVDISAQLRDLHDRLQAVMLEVSRMQRELHELEALYKQEQAAGERETILVVDDARLMRNLLRQILVSERYRVVEAESGAGALDVLRSHSIDLMIADLQMPDIDGFELLQRMRQDPRTARLPVLICSASREESDVRQGEQYGVRGFLQKPVAKAALLKAVAQALIRLDAPAERTA